MKRMRIVGYSIAIFTIYCLGWLRGYSENMFIGRKS